MVLAVESAVDRLTALLGRCEADLSCVAAERAAGDALAGEVGGALELRWRLAVLRAVMAEPPDADIVHELYGELVDRYRDDPTSLALVRTLGDEIRKRERDGTLPSALVVRSDRRKR